jgi:hypothetical protein
MSFTEFFGGLFFNGGFFSGGTPPTPTPDATVRGGSGGSNKAGKKKHSWERRGHVISAIQSGVHPDLTDLLPEETPQQVKITDAVDTLVVENDLQISTLEILLATVTEAIKTLETEEQTREEKNRLRLEAHAYKLKVREEFRLEQARLAEEARIAEELRIAEEKRVAKRRREEAILMHILQYA